MSVCPVRRFQRGEKANPAATTSEAVVNRNFGLGHLPRTAVSRGDIPGEIKTETPYSECPLSRKWRRALSRSDWGVQVSCPQRTTNASGGKSSGTPEQPDYHDTLGGTYRQGIVPKKPR